MYYLAHKDDRGASLTARDVETVLKAYPLDTPPVAYDRVIYVVSSPNGALANPDVNQVQLGFDLRGLPCRS